MAVNVDTSDHLVDATGLGQLSLEKSLKSSPVHILVVDDEPDIAESLSEFLSRKEGYTVSIAEDGLQAMQMLEESTQESNQAIDLVLLDVRMPLMSGPEVLEWLRNHRGLQYTRVIMLTAAAGYEEKVEALTAGADDYITKPYYPLELLARVKTILRTQQLEKQLQEQSQQLINLNRVSQDISAKLTSREVLTVAVSGLEEILDVEVTAVFMAGDEPSILECREVKAADPNVSLSSFRHVPIGKGVIGHTYLDGQAIALNTPVADTRFRSDIDAPDGYLVRSLISAPLFVRGKTVGVFYVMNKTHGQFTEVDHGLLTSLASAVGRAVEIAWLFQGIRQRQGELLESRNQLQAVIDGIAHPIYTINDDWQLVSINEAKRTELELSSEMLAGELCYKVFFDRSKPCDLCQVSKTMLDRVEQSWTVKRALSDHRNEEWDVNAYPIPGALSRSPKAVVVWQDRTEERRLEASLMQAGKLAAIGQLAAGVAHEINNPLTAINANAQMLQMVIPPDAEDYESVELIARAGERAAQVVRGLLDFARQTQYSFQSADINTSIRQALDLVSYQLTAAGIKIITDLKPDLPHIDASLEHLQSVWLNLLINARDAMNGSSRKQVIAIETKHDQDSGEILVSVRDTGRGMNATQINHIFEPFYTTKEPGEGTGLGLATCHRIVEQHGGHIEVASTPGKGSTFLVHLPITSRLKEESENSEQ